MNIIFEFPFSKKSPGLSCYSNLTSSGLAVQGCRIPPDSLVLCGVWGFQHLPSEPGVVPLVIPAKRSKDLPNNCEDFGVCE